MTQWVPLESRHDDVPAEIQQPLLDWLRYIVDDALLARILARAQADGARLKWAAQLRKHAGHGLGRPEHQFVLPYEILFELVHCDADRLLHLVDLALGEGVPDPDRTVPGLAALLDDAGSAWRVANGRNGLVLRVSETVANNLGEAVSAAAQGAAGHLSAAWRHAFALRPDPARAYSEAIRAVEVSAIPVVSPADARATLETVIRDLSREGPYRWRLAIPTPDPGQGLETLIGMLWLLWQGQQADRSGRPSPESAQAAVQLAVTLVQWFSTATLRTAGAP